MAKEKTINLSDLQVRFEDFMLKLGAEPRLQYYGSNLDDLYIMIQIEHDGVNDVALIDFFTDVVDMRIYDEYKFLVADHFKVDMDLFMNAIENMNTYSIQMNKLLTEGSASTDA